MSATIFLFSRKPLDVGVLVQCYRDFGALSMFENRLWIDCGDEGWLDFSFAVADTLDSYEPPMREKILSLIPQPVITGLNYKYPDLATQAVSRLPAWDDIWIENTFELLLTLQEVQQRIRLDTEWLMYGEEDASADLIVNYRDQKHSGVMAVLDDARLSDAARKTALLDKLARCVRYFGSGKFARSHYWFAGDAALAEVVYVAPPTPAMREITSVSDPAYPNVVLPVEFVTEAEFLDRHGFMPRDLPSLRDRY